MAFLITHYESILSAVSPSAGCSVFLSNHSSRKQSCPATRSRREDQALLLRRRLPLVPNKASSDAGPELAGSGSHKAMESPKAMMCPLEKGVRGIETGLQMPAEEQRSGGHALWCEAVLLATMNLITVKS